MALVTRRIALAVVAVSSMLASFILPATNANASSVPAPTLVSPASSTTTPLKEVVLQWNAVSGASLYQVQISANDEWTNNPVTLPSNGQTVNTLFEVPIGLPHGAYFWHVRAQVGGVWSAYSTAWQFLREWPINTIAILKAPTSADPTVEWAPLSDASLYQVSFVDVSTGKELDCKTEQTSFTPYQIVPSPTLDGQKDKGTPIPEDLQGTCFSESDLVDSHKYDWFILAIDDTSAAAVTTTSFNGDPLACKVAVPECGGFVGNSYVSPAPFTFVAPPVGNFDSTTTATGLTTHWHPASSASGTPCDSTIYCPVTPTFSWTPTPGANYYRVDVYLDPQHTNDYRTYTTAWPELTPRDFYLDSQTGYLWTVQPGSCAVSICSAPGNVSTCAPGTVNAQTVNIDDVVANAGGVVVDPNGPEIDGGGTYQITLSEPGGVATPKCVIPSSGSISGIPVVTGTSIEIDYVPPAEGSVTFEIVNKDGSETAASPAITVDPGTGLVHGQVSDVTIFSKRSGAVTPQAPVDGSTLHGGSVTFRWADFLATGGQTALEARNYELQVSQDPNFDATVIDVSDIDLTQYTDPTSFLKNGSYYWRVLAIDETGQQLTWSPIYHFTVDATNPTVSFLTPNGVGVGKQLLIQTSDRLTGVKTSTLRVVPAGEPVSDAVAGKITKGATPTMYTFTPNNPLGTGVTYVLVPIPSLRDGNGNPVVVTGSGVTTTLIAKSTSKSWNYSSGWAKYPTSSALSGHGFVYYAGAGRQTSLTVGGSEAHLFACIGPAFGRINISVGGHSKTISEHQKGFTTCGVEIWHRALPATPRKLTISVVSGFGNIDEVQVDPLGGATS